MKAFNDLADFSVDEIEGLIELANRLDAKPEPDALRGKVLSLLFLSPSLRTLASFQAAMVRLGGGSFVISPDMSIHGLETRPGIVMDGAAAEHIREAVPVIASYGDAIGIRAFAERKSIDYDLADTEFNAMTSLVDKPFINMESAINHPCQSLADWKTMDDLKIPASGGKFVLSWAYHPRPLPLAVPAATVHMAAYRGMDVTVLRPEGFELPDSIMKRAREAAEISGGSVRETADRKDAMEGAQVIYAKSWSSTKFYGDRNGDRDLRNPLDNWCVDDPWFGNAADDCRFMHCLPVRRGVVVSERVLDGPRSVVIHEARNRMLAQMAVLHQMLGRKS
ncbi:MAG: N-acetylornithine carbamoyltransferase [Gammaproteobacteria bacterium]|nr:N-acetylornithine carbamoyltransferase [Gammaproteobacteria bacterium]MDH5215184.1 N-acetylornithine carbamoyltransferase [Gammaproteobacteria bacterium]MDH5500017.1 N-acetylornithine carbamoyltransferase [Gammaproteobacteria bacterium]